MSADQFLVNTPGWFLTGYGQESSSYRFHRGTLYNDVAAGIIWVKNKVSLGYNKTVLGKEHFELWIWEQACVDIYHMHSENIIFASDQLHLNCEKKHQ